MDRPLTASDKEREDIEEMLQTDGWRWFVNYVMDRYQGGGYFNAMGQALKSDNQMKPMIFHETALEVMRVINAPAARLNQLRGDV